MDYRIVRHLLFLYQVRLAVPVITSIDPIEAGTERMLLVAGPFLTHGRAQRWIDKQGGQI